MDVALTGHAGSASSPRWRQLAPSRRLIAALMIAATVLLIAQGLLSIVLSLSVRGRFLTITKDSVPSIIAAQDLRAQVQDMDADLANTVLENANPGPGKRQEDWIAERAGAARKVIDSLGRAQANITFPGECEALVALQNAFVDYSTLAAQTEQTAKAAGGAFGAASNPQAVLLYRQAAEIVLNRIEPAITDASSQPSRAGILPPRPLHGCEPGKAYNVSAAGGLFTVNDDHEAAAYDGGRRLIGLGIALTLATGLLVSAVLVFANLRLARLTHRCVNAGLAAGAVIALVLAVFSAFELRGLDESFKVVSKDSLDSIKLALQMKSRGNLANADESRWLFDAANSQQWQTDFDRNGEMVDQAIKDARNNVTFTGERKAIDGTEGNTPSVATAQCMGGICKAWADYLTIDTRIRDLQKGGKHTDAVTLNLTDSNDAYARFLDGVGKLQDVNQVAYIDRAHGAETTTVVLAGASALLAIVGAVAVVLGIRRRLVEL